MEKTLREALPDLKTGNLIMEHLDDIRVLRMTMPRERNMLKIYISSPVILPKRDVYALEAAVKHQYFSSKEVKVRVYEYFRLSGIGLREAYEAYRESIALELKLSDLMEYNVFRSTELIFENDSLIRLRTPQNVVFRTYLPALANYLESLFCERFGLPVSVRIEYAAESFHVKSDTDAAVSEAVSVIAAGRDAAVQTEKEKQSAAAAEKEKKDYYAKKEHSKKFEEGMGYGYEFSGDPLPICEINEELGDVIIDGQVLKLEERELKTGNLMELLAVTDKTDTIMVKLFCKKEEQPSLLPFIKAGTYIRLKGYASFDKYDKEVAISHVTGLRISAPSGEKRTDTSPKKRVELHAHTQMSEMDAVTHTGALVNRAAAWGHPAVAITDHGVVQSFPEAMHAAERYGEKLKIIYGCEGYLVDDTTGKTAEELKSSRAYHVILLAATEEGRVNLYRMVSEAHLIYYHKRPRIPKSLLTECRKGIIVGSACEAGELYRALVRGESDEEIARLVNFYDYLEVQPIMNNAFMLRDAKNPCTEEDLRNYVRKIVALGEQFGKPVVATCDVHFLDPEDEIYRRIIQKGQGYADADMQPPLYFRTTEEMLAEFEFLGREKAEEIVITNSNLIADRCERISPVRPDKCPPVIEGSEEELQAMCRKRAHELYGPELPSIVQERMDRELTSIIGNGYAVMYIIAQRLVKKSNDDGYLVGSRGSVGSSFVAYLSGITEVNSLPPHYRCPRCFHTIFDNEETRANAGGVGVDMGDMKCPVCGTPMLKDGFDIPFEVFLGFKGDKEPDIDLNFSGEYQAKAHKYTEVLFGEGHTFKAGTVGGIADKTAYGYVKKYYEEKGIQKRSCEIERIAAGCVGVRRTTGQHPGGIVVMPHGENIYTFTPIQHPANDMKSDIITTHFEYHSIDHNLLKLDILGHDDPTMIRRLEDLIGMDAKKIPLDDPDVISLFHSTDVLGITPEQLNGCPLGTLGIPEFGTDFAMGIVMETKPRNFADLIRIAGISHGTDVWQGNIEVLIRDGVTDLEHAICNRDDIMLSLIHKGMDPAKSFSIMESVRKGKVAGKKVKEWPDWKEDMKQHDVPDWFIGSCEKIQYMFPKAHAAAYVMMAWRVAYCKVHHPLEYYTAYFSIRADGFSYQLMCMGQDAFRQNIRALRTCKSELSDKEKLILRDMRLVEEMFARGIDFLPIDIYRAKADRFQIIGGKIMPSFASIEGMGDKAAQDIETAARDGKFLSREDLIQRAHISSTLADTLAELGILGPIPKSNQLSFEDIMLL